MKLYYLVFFVALSLSISIDKRPHRGENEEPHSHDLHEGDQNDRTTEKMSKFSKMNEDNHHQGKSINGGNARTGSTSSSSSQPKQKSDKIVPVTIPKHVSRDAHNSSQLTKDSDVGASIVRLSVDNEEKAQRLVKKLFSKALIAQAEITEGGVQREYIMMGSIHTDNNKVYLELTTSDARVTELVDFINKNYHPGYDYPVDDITVEPISVANSSFINWVKG